jgi:glutamyl-tRNA synthetase
MLGFLFTDAAGIDYQDDALKSLPQNAAEVLSASSDALGVLPESEWNAQGLQAALAATLIEGLGLKPRIAYGPLRVAVSGRRVSPPLFESMVILGKTDTLARLSRLSAHLSV